MEQFIFILFVILVIIFSIIAWLHKYNRIKEWREFALRHGLYYLKIDTGNIPQKYSNFQLFQQGSGKKASNISRGRENNADICIFDYQYVTGSGKNRQTHYRSGLILTTDMVFKHLLIRPEHFFDKISSAFGFNDINFESSEFSKKFYVKSEDKKFAYDMIHPRMMEFLLECGRIIIETDNRSVLFHRDKQLSISEMELLLIQGYKFISLTPDYVRNEIELIAGKGA